MLTNDGKSFCFTDASQNNKPTEFRFAEADVIDVTLSYKEIFFANRRTNQKTMMKIDISEKEWKNVGFCALLNEPQDEIEIVR